MTIPITVPNDADGGVEEIARRPTNNISPAQTRGAKAHAKDVE